MESSRWEFHSDTECEIQKWHLRSWHFFGLLGSPNRGKTSQEGSNTGDPPCGENTAGDTPRSQPRLCQAHWIHQQSTWTHLPSSFPTWSGTWGHGSVGALAVLGVAGLKDCRGLFPPKGFCVIQVSCSVFPPPGNSAPPRPKSTEFPPSQG